MVRKVKKKKSGIRIFVALLLMVGIAAFVYKSIIIPGYQHIFEKEYDDKTTSYSSLKTTPDSSDDRTTSAPSSKIELDPLLRLTRHHQPLPYRVNFLLHFLIKVNQPLELKILV